MESAKRLSGFRLCAMIRDVQRFDLRRTRNNRAITMRSAILGALFLLGISIDGADAVEPGQTIVAGAFAPIADVVEREIAAGKIPGAVVLIGKHDRILYREAFGLRSVVPSREKMTIDTIFDLASLTKVVATTPAIMQLIERHRLALDDKVARYWPAFAANGKQDVTIEELFTHTSGLRPDLDLRTAWKGRPSALLKIEGERPTAEPATRFLYSDINFETLGELVQRISGQTLDTYAKRHIFGPLHMASTGFRPTNAMREQIAPTSYQDAVLRWGVVQDPTAYRMGGVAGDAGLFGTADDLAQFASMVLNGGSLGGIRILDLASVARMKAVRDLPGGIRRALGWDVASPLSAGFDKAFGITSFGHTGYTGTSLWIDPSSDSYLIILTSRLHPDDRGDVRALRDDIAKIVAAAVKPPKVETGIDRLEAEEFSSLAGLRVGLVTNESARDGQGRRTIDVLAKAPGVRLVALFTPEHGLGANQETKIEDSVDPASGVPIYSLYGHDRRPTDAALKQLDAFVVDLQDVGVRFFTYASTMAYVMEAAAPLDIPVFVLDRPNPIDADIIEGPISEGSNHSFTGYLSMPLRHGMTLGELARFFNQENRIGAKLTIVAMQNYRRGSWFDETGLAWISPSPNLPSLEAATLYPGVGLIEGANISVGRGTSRPFALVGAPWIDGNRLARELQRHAISGIAFEPASFTPTKDRYAGHLCHGVSLLLTDRRALDLGRLGLELIAALHRLYPVEFEIARTRGLVGSIAAYDAIAGGTDPRDVNERSRAEIENFRKLRNKYLLYP